MRAHFLEGDFDLPAADEPGEDVARMSVEIGCQECLRIEFAFGIANQEPADRHGRHAAAIPQRGSGGDLDDTIGSAVPEADAVALPGDFTIDEDGRELFLALALDRWPAPALAPLRREIEQGGVKAQAGGASNRKSASARSASSCSPVPRSVPMAVQRPVALGRVDSISCKAARRAIAVASRSTEFKRTSQQSSSSAPDEV